MSNIPIICDPANKNNWFKDSLPPRLDPVLSNIYNGCWQCNHTDSVFINDKLLTRTFFDGYINKPYVSLINKDSEIRNLNNKNLKNCLI